MEEPKKKPKLIGPVMVRINALIPEFIHKAIQIDAIREGTTVASLIEEALMMYSKSLRKLAAEDSRDFKAAHKALVHSTLMHIGVIEERKKRKAKRKKRQKKVGMDWRTRKIRERYPGMAWRKLAGKNKPGTKKADNDQGTG